MNQAPSERFTDPEAYAGSLEAVIEAHYGELESIVTEHGEHAADTVRQHCETIIGCTAEDMPDALRKTKFAVKADFTHSSKIVERVIGSTSEMLESMLSPADTAELAEARSLIDRYGVRSPLLKVRLVRVKDVSSRQAIKTILDKDILSRVMWDAGVLGLDQEILGKSRYESVGLGFGADSPIVGQDLELASHPTVKAAMSASLDIARLAKTHYHAKRYGTDSPLTTRPDLARFENPEIAEAASASLDLLRIVEILRLKRRVGADAPIINTRMDQIPSDETRATYREYLESVDVADIDGIIDELIQPQFAKAERYRRRVFRAAGAVLASLVVATGAFVVSQNGGGANHAPAATAKPFHKPARGTSPTSSPSPSPSRLTKQDMVPPLNPIGGEWQTAEEAAWDAGDYGNHDYVRDDQIAVTITNPQIRDLAMRAVQAAEGAEIAYASAYDTFGAPVPHLREITVPGVRKLTLAAIRDERGDSSAVGAFSQITDVANTTWFALERHTAEYRRQYDAAPAK